MIEATQRKLREAHFFYRQLVTERDRTFRNEPEAFRYYFSAFLSAARSVPWVMKKEEKAKYLVWKPTWDEQLTIEERKLEKLTNELRLDEVKRAGATTIVEPEEIAIHELFSASFDLERQHPAYGMHVSAQPGVPAPSAKFLRPVHYLEDEGGKVEATAKCKQYLEYLEKLVRDFLAAHAQSNGSAT
jgi:hypothetical protein